MKHTSALTAGGRAARASTANGMQERHGPANGLHATVNAGTATKAWNRSNAFAHEPANV